MERKPGSADADQAKAGMEHEAQQHLMRLGADKLPPPPWRTGSVPPSAVELVRFALWKSGDLAPEDIAQALALLPAARAEVEGMETGLIFVARCAGLTWAKIAGAMGFKSPQACQQHYTRLAARQESGA